MSRRPHVVVIVVDDLGWRDLTCTGSDFYETPHLDALAAAGMMFTQAYSGAPNCSPTRASLMTGKAPARVGVTNIIGGHRVGRLCDAVSRAQLPVSEYSLARALRAGGYRTWHVGKWHLGGPDTWPERHGFDINVGGCAWGHPPTYTSPWHCPTLTDGPEGEYLTDRLTDEAIALIRGAAADGDDTPFFLNLWHYAVHTPITGPPELVEKYRRKAEAMGRRRDLDVVAGDRLPYWQPGEERVVRRVRQGDPGYAAMIENLDTNVGRLLGTLAELGLAEDTLVVLTSDNGGLHSTAAAPTANLPLAEGKGWLQEAGIRVPLLVRGPGVAAGTTSAEPVISADLYPTLLSACGLDPIPQQHRDGVDLTGVLAGGRLAGRPLFWHFPHYAGGGGTPASAVRRGRWKLIRDHELAAERLHDLETDPGETHDLLTARPDVGTELAALLDAWLVEVDARVGEPTALAPFGEYAPDIDTAGTGRN